MRDAEILCQNKVATQLNRSLRGVMTLLGFAFEEDVGEGKADSGNNETVESVPEYCHTSEIRILPKSIDHRVVEPVVIAIAV